MDIWTGEVPKGEQFAAGPNIAFAVPVCLEGAVADGHQHVVP